AVGRAGGPDWPRSAVTSGPSGDGVRAGDLHAVVAAKHVDADAGTVLGRVDHVSPQVGGDIHLAARGELQLAGAVLDVRQAVDVEFEHVRGVLRAEAIAGAQILVDP